MKIEAPIFFCSREALFQWFSVNHDQADAKWFGFYKKSTKKPGISYQDALKSTKKPGITYQDALNASLCYGWIDGVRKRIDDLCYSIRFTPRKPGSTWSKVNIKRAWALIETGEMHQSGLKAFRKFEQQTAGKYSYEERRRKLDPEYQKLFKANTKAWDFYNSQTPYYRRITSWWVMSAKREETRRRRLTTLINDSAQGRKIGLMGT